MKCKVIGYEIRECMPVVTFVNLLLWRSLVLKKEIQ